MVSVTEQKRWPAGPLISQQLKRAIVLQVCALLDPIAERKKLPIDAIDGCPVRDCSVIVSYDDSVVAGLYLVR